MATPSEDDLIQALLEARRENTERPHGAVTVAELAERMGHDPRWVREWLQELKSQGQLGTIKIRQENIGGSITLRPAYYLSGQE